MRRRLLFVFLLPLAGLAGCGDSGSSGPTVPEEGPAAFTLEENQCEWGGLYPNCTSPPGTGVECPALDPNCSGGGIPGTPDGGTSPGGGENPKGEEPEPDSCDTDYPELNSGAVQDMMDAMWELSYPDKNLAQRVERGGWIVQTPTGYKVQPWQTATVSFCGIDGNVPLPTDGGAVGFIHTHPYRVGETVVNCKLPLQDYRGDASDTDRDMSLVLGQVFNQPEGLPGYIMDANGITVFKGEQRASDDRIRRCGY